LQPRFGALYRGFCAIGGRDKEKTKSKNTVENAKSASKKASKATQRQKKKIEEHKSQKQVKRPGGAIDQAAVS
jgi:hypothetical protein